jgi:tungstate transport system substrate-binding protein
VVHNRRPLRIASTIGPVETGLLPALEAAYSRRSALPVEHDALGTGAVLERAKRGGIDLVIAHAPEAAARGAYTLLDRRRRW